MSDSDRREQARPRQRRAADEERERRERLLHEVESVALDFLHEPEQIGYYLADCVRLRPGDRERIEELLYTLGGAPVVARAFAASGFISAPDALPAKATTADWLAGKVPELYDSGRSASIGGAVVADWRSVQFNSTSRREAERRADETAEAVVEGESADEPLDRAVVPPPRPGSWADAHERKRRRLADDVVEDWREAAARVAERSAAGLDGARSRPAHGGATSQQDVTACALFKRQHASDDEALDEAAAVDRGVSGASQQLPYLDRIQKLFGHHDVRDIEAHLGSAAQAATTRLEADGYSLGGKRVAFRGIPDLRTAAHEAAHVVQQREGLAPSTADADRVARLERHADVVADRVVRGGSAQSLLDEVTGPPAKPGA